MNIFSLIRTLHLIPNIHKVIPSIANAVIPNILEPEVLETPDYKKLINKKLAIEIKDIHSIYQLTFLDDVILLESNNVNKAACDLVISSYFTSLESLANKTAYFDELIKDDSISFTGDRELLFSLFNVLSYIDFSLDNILSKYVGDEMAYIVSKAVNKAGSHMSSVKNSVTELALGSSTSDQYDPFIDHSKEKQKYSKISDTMINLIESLNIEICKDQHKVIGKTARKASLFFAQIADHFEENENSEANSAANSEEKTKEKKYFDKI